MTKGLAFLLMSFVFILAIILGEDAKDNLGSAMAVGAIFYVFISVPIALLVAIVARDGLHLHLHLHKHEQSKQLREPIDVDARMVEGPAQVTVRKE